MHAYMAEPERLTAVPRGIVNPHTRLETPARFSTQSMTTGSDAAEEPVEKPVNKAGKTAL